LNEHGADPVAAHDGAAPRASCNYFVTFPVSTAQASSKANSHLPFSAIAN
jgi:hypothetical protein